MRVHLPTLFLLALLAPAAHAQAVPAADSAAAPARAAAPAPPAITPPRLGGYVQAREIAAHGMGLTATLNRARLTADGGLPRSFSYQVMVEFEAAQGPRSASTPSLREALVRWKPGAFALTAGQMKAPFSREFLVPSSELETADFAALVDSLAPHYELGVMGDWSARTWLDLAAGVFNGEGQNASANRDSTVLGVGRVVARPFAGMAIGGSVALDSADSLRWVGDVQLERRGATVRAEYTRRHVAGQAADQADRGWYVLGLYRVRANVRLQCRQEDFERPAYGVARRVRGTTLGVDLDLVPGHVRLIVDGTNKAFGAAQRHAHTLIAQLQARF